MRLLITGGAGFIGSHIAEAAVDRNWEVICVDDLSSGRKENVPRGAALVKVDIRDSDRLAKLFEDFRPNAVSHQAAQVSVLDSQQPVFPMLRVAQSAGALRSGPALLPAA